MKPFEDPRGDTSGGSYGLSPQTVAAAALQEVGAAAALGVVQRAALLHAGAVEEALCRERHA